MQQDLEKLVPLGWCDFFATELPSVIALEDELGRELRIGRVSSEQRYHLDVMDGDGVIRARVAGRVRHAARDDRDLPTAGDWVALDTSEDDEALAVFVFPRRSEMVRQAAGRKTLPQVVGTNLDTVFITTSMNQDFNPRRLERYLVMVYESGAQPAIALTKADLVDDPAPFIDEAHAVAPGCPIIVVAALEQHGLDALAPHLALGRTVGLVGSSGVGKSTLINALVGQEVQKTVEIRERDDRGRHGTTFRQLVLLPAERGILLDTPGMRELSLWSADAGLALAFPEISSRAELCRFRTCRHVAEPDCEVLAAVDEGLIAEERIEHFLHLRDELEAQQERRKEWAEIQEQRKSRTGRRRRRR